ncbi:NAD(P)-dependent oxidoreductase [Shimia sediminis]|uniref:NAD(P)-dependent oxidoreductase n=1 Tax=Shimia sediminis TaxID=2497945 RepID=UPI000F8F2A8F|nr:NAD(P)-dependent oxidoreductase [Shimia sediminis]
MTLLIDGDIQGWFTDDELRDAVQVYDPTLEIRTLDEDWDPKGIRMIAVSRLRPDLPARLPNLELVQKLGAGVETIVGHSALPDHVRVARLKPQAPAREIAEYCLAYVLREQRNMRFHESEQKAQRWTSVAPRENHKTTVGILGLGHIGGFTARLFRQFGFQVLGWSRSQKQLADIETFHGPTGLRNLLNRADHVCAILPSTDATRGMFNAGMFDEMKSGSTFVNAGRGDLVDETALVEALDRNCPGHAVLDVLSEEPLPTTSPLWEHPRVTLTPHVSGWHLGDAFGDVAQNYRNLMAGAPLLHEVDRKRGY